MDSSLPERWLRGPIAGFAPLLQPVAHSLLQSRDELEQVETLTLDELWLRPGNAAAAGFHLRHIAGSLDRLLTYARGESLGPEQRTALAREDDPGEPPASAAQLVAEARSAIERALEQVHATGEDTLLEPRGVGRAQLPSTVLGLLFHAAEHTQRHAGQLITTARVVRGLTLTQEPA